MLNVRNIIEGWGNVIFENPQVEELAIERASACASCPHSERSSLLTFVGNDLIDRDHNLCGVCGCPLAAKLRSPREECLKKLWKR